MKCEQNTLFHFHFLLEKDNTRDPNEMHFHEASNFSTAAYLIFKRSVESCPLTVTRFVGLMKLKLAISGLSDSCFHLWIELPHLTIENTQWDKNDSHTPSTRFRWWEGAVNYSSFCLLIAMYQHCRTTSIDSIFIAAKPAIYLTLPGWMAPVVSLWDFHFFLLLRWASYLQDFLTAYSISFPKPVVCHPDAVTDVLQPWGQPVTKGGWANTVAVCVPYYSQDQERKMKLMLCSEPANMRLTCTMCPLLQPWAGAGEAQLSQAVSIYPSIPKENVALNS